jgi:hypothetical protein
MKETIFPFATKKTAPVGGLDGAASLVVDL